MCGLVGMAGNVYVKDTDAFKELLWVDALRGMHSTGIAVVDKDGDTELVKAAGTPLRLYHEGDFHKLLRTSSRVFIGHNRFATVGDVTAENAHPYDFDFVVGAHNGTLSGRSDHHLDNRKDYGTDSMALYANISDRGIEDVMPQMQGAWAMTWYNKVEGTINFLRNEDRPFHYCFNDTGQVIYWASEAWMLKGVLERNKIKIHSSGILSLNANQWVKWEVPTKQGWVFGEPSVTELKGYSAPPFVHLNRRVPTTGEEQKFGDVIKGWAPQRLSLPAPNGPASPLKNASGKQPSGQGATPNLRLVEKSPGTTTTPHPDAQYIKAAYHIGLKAGKAGKSLASCPFHPGSDQRASWEEGRLHGIEETTGYGPDVKTIVGFRNEILDEKTWKETTEGGCCSWCGNPTVFGEKATWTARDTFFCEPCVKQEKLDTDFLAVYA